MSTLVYTTEKCWTMQTKLSSEKTKTEEELQDST